MQKKNHYLKPQKPFDADYWLKHDFPYFLIFYSNNN
jgi:hypothetical protein